MRNNQEKSEDLIGITKDSKAMAPWTVFKEITGTFFGMAPFIIALVLWGSSINERIRVIEVRVEHSEQFAIEQKRDTKEQRQELIARLDRLSAQMEYLQQSVAKVAK